MQQGKFHCDKCGAIHYSFYDFHGHEHVRCLVGGGHWVSERRHLTMRAADATNCRQTGHEWRNGVCQSCGEREYSPSRG